MFISFNKRFLMSRRSDLSLTSFQYFDVEEELGQMLFTFKLTFKREN